LGLLPSIDDDDEVDIKEDEIVPDNINQKEAADHSVQNRYNPDSPLMEQAAHIVDDIRKRFAELRDLAKKNGIKDPETVGLSQNNELSACRRALEALHDYATVDRGPDDIEVKALRKLANKLRNLEKPSKTRNCQRCNSKLGKNKCAVTVDGVTYKRCLEDNPQCESCEVCSSSTTCLSKFSGEKPECGPLHGTSYYQKKVVSLAKVLLGDEEKDDSISFTCENAPEFKFWREIQQLLNEANVNYNSKVKGQGCQAAKTVWKNRENPEHIFEELSHSAAFYECLQKCQVDISMSCCFSIVGKAHAREVFELSILAVMAVAEWSVFEDDMLVLAHTF
jgi:hypothetical protein